MSKTESTYKSVFSKMFFIMIVIGILFMVVGIVNWVSYGTELPFYARISVAGLIFFVLFGLSLAVTRSE